MAQRWPAPNVKPKLSQAEFDDAVRTNIEDFDMVPEEAVKSAVEEFSLQGYDLTCVVKTAAGGDLAKHPVSVGTEAISEAGTDGAALAAAYTHLTSLMQGSGAADTSTPDAQQQQQEKPQEAVAVAAQSSSLSVVVSSLKAFSEASSSQEGAAQVIKAGLVACKSLMAPSLDIRDTWDNVGGPQLVLQLHTQHAGNIDLQAEIASCCECSCYREEQNKEQAVETGFVASLLGLLDAHSKAAASESDANGNGDVSPSTTFHEDFVVAACGVLRSVCTADDDRPPSSKAFQTARILATQQQALQILLRVLRLMRSYGSSPTVVAAVLNCVRQLSANDEICKNFSDVGGINTILALLGSSGLQSKDLARCGLGALRQLTHSDVTKKLLAEEDAIHLLMKLTSAYEGDAEVVEPALGVAANMTLRQPETVTAIAEVGAIDWVLAAMRQMPDSSIVQRQAAILSRNMVVRNTELRRVFLDKGAEALLRAAKKAHPRNCTDVGSAALRDLGLDDYNK